jgi:uracil-DNA glycosylase family 4
MSKFAKPSICNCAECPLRNQPFCPNEVTGTPRCVWMGESPGGKEILQGRPFIGPSGRRLERDARIAKLNRQEAVVMNAVCCRPLKKMTDSQWTRAVTCCAPQREHWMAKSTGPILAMGKWALYATTGKESIEAWYGYPLMRPDGREVVGAPHPARVLRQPHWAGEWLTCLKWFSEVVEGTFKPWERPPIWWREPDWFLADKLDAMDREVICIDSETAGLDPQFDKVICFGASDGNTAVTLIWPPGPRSAAALQALIAEADRLVGHNIQHDLLALEQLGLTYHQRAVEDTLHQHSILQPEMPHRLGICTATRWRQPRWKSIHDDEASSWQKMLEACRADGSKMDELCEYNGMDCINGANLWKEQHVEMVKAAPNKADTYALLRQRSWVALDMRRHGIRVDRQRRAALVAKFTARADAARDRFEKLVAAGYWPQTNLGARGITDSVKHLFFKHFGLYPLAFTDSGAEACDAWSLQRWANRFQADDTAALAAKLVLRYRTSTHMAGMVESLRISPDGRVHPPWNPAGAVTDRWSCGKPNLMNLPKRGINNLRAMFIPDHGHMFVLADSDKVELRVVAILAGDKPLLRAFDQGIDVHQANAVDLFGPGATPAQRDLAKRFVYGANYGASAETLWRNLVTVFPKLQLKLIKALRTQWFKKHPAIKAFLDANLLKAKLTGSLTPGVGPRSWEFYENQVDPNEVYNRPIQATVAWAINRALCRLYDEGFQIAWQCHDEIGLHVPVYRKWAAAESLAQAMEEEVQLVGRNWVLPCEPEQGTSWGDHTKLEEPCGNFGQS